jgi:hypothetical protein
LHPGGPPRRKPKKGKESNSALGTIAKVLARKHRFREAREAAEWCEQPQDRLDAYTTILSELTKLSKPQLATILDELTARSMRPMRGRGSSGR